MQMIKTSKKFLENQRQKEYKNHYHSNNHQSNTKLCYQIKWFDVLTSVKMILTYWTTLKQSTYTTIFNK